MFLYVVPVEDRKPSDKYKYKYQNCKYKYKYKYQVLHLCSEC